MAELLLAHQEVSTLAEIAQYPELLRLDMVLKCVFNGHDSVRPGISWSR